jgi:AcrR family transcriptional regulator
MIRPIERADARANRRRVIEAAHAVFRERGLDAEIKEIAERAGLGIGTIYRNFPTKDDLITAIVAEAVERINTNLAAAAALPDPVQAIHVFLAGGMQVLEQYGDLLMAMMGGDLPPASRDLLREKHDLCRVTELVQRGIDAGIFRADLDAEITAARLVSTFVPWHFARLRQRYSLDELVAAHADLFLRGTLARSGEDEADQPGRTREGTHAL